MTVWIIASILPLRLWLWSIMKAMPERSSRRGAEDLVEDAEDLVGIDGAEGEIVVGVLAVVEVEAAESVRGGAARRRSARCWCPGSDGRCRRGLWPSGRRGARARGPCPSRRCRCDRRRARRACTRRACAGRRPGLHAWRRAPLPSSRCGCECFGCRDSWSRRRSRGRRRASRSSRPISTESSRCARASFANLGIRVGDGAELVVLVLKEIGIDGAGLDAVLLLQRLDGRDVGFAAGAGPTERAAQRWDWRR